MTTAMSNDHGRPSLDGRVGRFVAQDRVAGWVRANGLEGQATVVVRFQGKVVGTGKADRPRTGDAQEDGRLGFNVKLAVPVTELQAGSDEFEVVATLAHLSVPLRKSPALMRAGTATAAPVVAVATSATAPAGTTATGSVELSSLNVQVGTQSADGAAIVGRNGYLFLVGGTNNVGQMYQTPDNGISVAWLDVISRRAALCDRLGARFLQVLVPEKTTVLSQYFPFELSVPSPVYANVKAAIAQEPALQGKSLQLEDLLGDQVTRERAYRKTDTHLTSEGAQALFAAQLRMLGERVDYVPGNPRVLTDTWDLGEKFSPLVVLEETEIFRDLSVGGEIMVPRLAEEHLPPNGQVGTRRVYRNAAAPIRKKVVAFANSFYWSGGTSLGQCWWYSRIFSEFHFVWSPEVDIDYAERVRPDIVIAQTIERFMRRVPAK